MNKTRMRKAKYLKTDDLKVIRKIQDLYIKNLIAYKDNLHQMEEKQVIKNTYKIVDLVKSLEESDDNFASSWIKNEVEQLEDSDDHYSFGTRYEQVQVAIHSSLRDIGFGNCIDHKVNIHYCKTCQVRLGIGEDNLYE